MVRTQDVDPYLSMSPFYLPHTADLTCTLASKRENIHKSMVIYRGLGEGFSSRCWGNKDSKNFFSYRGAILLGIRMAVMK